MTCFIYILDSSNSSSFTFWTSQFTSSSRCNWTGISTGNSNGSWTDKHSSHFSKAKEMSVKATFFYVKTTTNKFWNDAEMLLKTKRCRWNPLVIKHKWYNLSIPVLLSYVIWVDIFGEVKSQKVKGRSIYVNKDYICLLLH